MVNNFEQIKNLLSWRTADDFYYIQILQRKKDHKDNMRVGAANNNARLVKAYYVKSMEQLEFIEPEIIELCELFNARAGINLNRRSFKKAQLKTMRKILDQMDNLMYDRVHKAYDTVVGKYHNETNKRWIIDIDFEDNDDRYYGVELGNGITTRSYLDVFLTTLQPEGYKIIAKIPSKSGFHLITTPFNKMEFKKEFPKVDIQDNNPTNLYIP